MQTIWTIPIVTVPSVALLGSGGNHRGGARSEVIRSIKAQLLKGIDDALTEPWTLLERGMLMDEHENSPIVGSFSRCVITSSCVNSC